MLPTENITINGETITPDMVASVEAERPPIQVMGPNDFISHGHVIPGDCFQHFAPGPVTYVTLHMKDGRILTTTLFN